MSDKLEFVADSLMDRIGISRNSSLSDATN